MLELKRAGRQIVWPSNIDSTKTRLQGRKIPMPRAVKQPSLREVIEAARILGLNPQPTEKAANPRATWEKTGFVEVTRNSPKIQILKSMAVEVARLRQRQAEQSQPHHMVPRRK